jgi:hypothetical protein
MAGMSLRIAAIVFFGLGLVFLLFRGLQAKQTVSEMQPDAKMGTQLTFVCCAREE